MTRIGSTLAWFVTALPSVALAAGFAHDGNFIVMAPNQSVAEDVLVAANGLRAQVAKQWLGQELPPSVGRTVISVAFSEYEDSGLTWAIDTPERTLHKIWLKTSPAGAIDSTLAHEMVHVVLATRFADRLPAWVEEGAASAEDDPNRRDTRRRILAWYVRTGNWPDLHAIFQMASIGGEDQATYSVAASVTEYLLERGSKATFLQFAVAGKQNGWDRALETYYGWRSISDLQAAWQAWASRTIATAPDQLARRP